MWPLDLSALPTGTLGHQCLLNKQYTTGYLQSPMRSAAYAQQDRRSQDHSDQTD
jgi:hypothetical protein